MTTKRIPAGRAADLYPGARRMIQTPLENVLVLNANGEFYAISNTCPHAGGYLNYGPLDGYIIECPLHFWPFDVRDGCLSGMEESGLSDRLQTYPVEVEGEQLYILLPDNSKT